MLTTPSRLDKDTCPEDGRNTSIQLRVLHEACVKLGGERHLAEYLNVSVGYVHAWLKGRGAPPDAIFLKCLDLLEKDGT
jgi:DNA-binding transcriptional regulator YiaG